MTPMSLLRLFVLLMTERVDSPFLHHHPGVLFPKLRCVAKAERAGGGFSIIKHEGACLCWFYHGSRTRVYGLVTST